MPQLDLFMFFNQLVWLYTSLFMFYCFIESQLSSFMTVRLHYEYYKLLKLKNN